MGRAGGGRNEVDSRFISMFAVFNLLFPEDQTLTHIYNSILKGHLQTFSSELIVIADYIIAMTLTLFKVNNALSGPLLTVLMSESIGSGVL